jgi:hypothetical protein
MRAGEASPARFFVYKLDLLQDYCLYFRKWWYTSISGSGVVLHHWYHLFWITFRKGG